MEAKPVKRTLWQRIYALVEAGFDVMARYPYDLTELHWNHDLYEPPAEDGDTDGEPPRRPTGPGSGRRIKVVPPPASQRYQDARPTHIRSRRPKRKQPV